MRQIILHMPEELLKLLDDLVASGKYPSRAEAIRNAIRDLLQKEHPKYK